MKSQAQIRLRISGPSGRSREAVCMVPPEGLLLGRANPQLGISDRECSRRHALLIVLDRGVVLQDLDSRNGSYVEGNRQTIAEVIQGSRIRIGRTSVVIVGLDYVEGRKGPPPFPASKERITATTPSWDHLIERPEYDA